MIDPITCGQDLRVNDLPCIPNVNKFVNEIQKINSEMDRKLNTGTWHWHECRQNHHNADECIREYAN